MLLPPQLADSASIETVALYYREGRTRLRGAMADFPDLEPWEALIRLHEQGGAIRGKTARKYFQEDFRTLGLCLRFRAQAAILESVARRLKAAIDNRRGRPAKYGSGKKAKNVTEAEAIAVFNELKTNALAKRYMTDALVALFVLIAAHSGLRPIEMIGASLDGTSLTLKNAKKKPGLGETRQIDLQGLPDDVLTAVGLMIELVPDFASRAQYRSWAKDVAEALARACKRAGVRRLSLYSFRHLALATWKRAGVSAHDLAALAGHLSERSARNYAGARHGHRRKNIVRPVAGLDLTSVVAAAATQNEPSAATTEKLNRQSAYPVAWEEFPTPKSSKSARRPAPEPSAVKQYFDRLIASADAASVNHLRHYDSDEETEHTVSKGKDTT